MSEVLIKLERTIGMNSTYTNGKDGIKCAATRESGSSAPLNFVCDPEENSGR
jgi:hypothetical protein